MFYTKEGTIPIYFTEKGDISEFPTDFYFEIKEELSWGAHQEYQKKLNENIVYKGKEVRVRGEIMDAERILLKSAVISVHLLDENGKELVLDQAAFLRDMPKFKVGILQKLISKIKEQYDLNPAEEEDENEESEEKN